jgi:prolyl oligopeptidase PreP (S9A serine peptidase family)
MAFTTQRPTASIVVYTEFRHIPEFGTVKNKPEFDALREMSTYEHTSPGTAYPALLLVVGIK